MNFFKKFFKKIKKNKRQKALDTLTFCKQFGYLGYNRYNTKEEKVIRLIKGEFDVYHGMSVEEFFSIYNTLIYQEPEKLI